MTRPAQIITSEIELVAAIMTATNTKPVSITPGRELVEFTFPSNENTESVAIKYASCSLFHEFRRLANNRSWLYRQIREVARSGAGVKYGR
jgi:hypothetical protein